MKNIKMLLALMLIGCMVLGLCACGGGSGDDWLERNAAVLSAGGTGGIVLLDNPSQLMAARERNGYRLWQSSKRMTLSHNSGNSSAR